MLFEVIPNLYISDIRAAQDLKALNQNFITHIVQAMGGVDPQFPAKFKYLVLPVADLPNENII